MTLLLATRAEDTDGWTRAFAAHLPEVEVCVWPRVGDPRAVEYALVWAPAENFFDELTALKAIFCMGAGVDKLRAHAGLPAGVPIVRMVEPALTEGMSQFVLYHVLRFHRRMDEYQRQQRRRVWRPLPQVPASERRVGVMGLGALGGDVARRLVALDFAVAGWSRTARSLPGVECFHSDSALTAFLQRAEILVCLLPLTPATEGLLDAVRLRELPPGACLINASRGALVDEPALLEALDSGHLAGAALDVFAHEPLPPQHPFWEHPAVAVTPHAASLTVPGSAAAAVAANIRRLARGEALTHVVDRRLGY